jgi:WD40 repeat protein
MQNSYFKLTHTLQGHTEYLICLTISPDGNFLISSCYDTIKLWDLRDGTLMFSREHYRGSQGFSLIISPDWTNFITDYDDCIEVQDLLTGEKVFNFWADSSNAMAISPDGTYIVIAEYVKFHPNLPGVYGSLITPTPINIWSLQTGKLISALRGHDYMASSLIISQDGSKLLSHSSYYSTKVWDLQNGQELYSFSLRPQGYKHWIDAFAVTFTGEIVGSGYKFKADNKDCVNFEMWNLSTGQVIHSFSSNYYYQDIFPDSELKSDMTPDSKTLVSMCQTNLDVWDGETGAKICTLQGFKSSCKKSLTISQNGRKIVNYGDGLIQIWER